MVKVTIADKTELNYSFIFDLCVFKNTEECESYIVTICIWLIIIAEHKFVSQRLKISINLLEACRRGRKTQLENPWPKKNSTQLLIIYSDLFR